MGKSSRDKRDIYYRLAKEEGWRARSAYKLMQIDDEFGILNSTEDDPLERVVDLCAAPGSWSQVLSKRLWEPKPPEDRVKVKIVAVDLQAMAPIPGVVQIQGDITSSQTANQIIDCFCGKLAQLVVCDGAPDVTGLHDLDEYVQSHLILAALTICARILQRGGTFVAKVFRSRDAGLLGSQLRCLFDGPVTFAKPRSSRNSSLEAFVVCQGYSGPRMRSQLSAVVTEESKEQGNETQSTSSTNSNSKEDVQEVDPLLLQWYDPNNFEEISPDQKSLLPFVACGDLSGFDADLCYSLQADYVSLPPVQCPIDPAYSDVCRRARSTLNHKETQPETTEASKPSSLSPSQQTDSSSAVADYGIAELLRFLNMVITDLSRTPRITSQISSTSAECEHSNVKEELARFQPTTADKNRVFYISVFYLAVALFIGIPMWLKTTATYQAPLPFWEIKALCSRPIEIRIPVNIVSLSQKLTLSELGTIQSSLMNSEDPSLRCGSGKSSDRLRISCAVVTRHASHSERVAFDRLSDAAADFGTLLNELETTLFGILSRKNATTTCSSEAEGFCTESASTYKAVLLPHTIYDRFKLGPDSEGTIQRSAAHNLLYLIEPRSDGQTNATHTLASQIAKLMNSVFVPIADLEHLTTPVEPTLTEPGQRSSARPRTSSQLLHLLSRQLPASSAYDITVTLLTHSGEANRLSSQSRDDWSYRVLSDPTAWLQTHVERVFRSWMPYVRFQFYSQRLYAVDIEQLGPSRLSENHTYRYYTRDDLSTVVNQLESYLGAPQTASAATRDMAGTKPGLHLILLLAMPTIVTTNHSEVPPVVECPRPLRFYLPSTNGSLALTNVAVVPQWGGLFSIDAPTPCSKSSDVAAITGRQLVTVIRSLAGLPEPVELPTHRLNPPVPLIGRLGEVDHWELDGWFLKRTVESLLAVRMTMTALVDLLSRFPNMVINDHVATEVARSGRVWAQVLDDLRQMDSRNYSIDLGEIFTHTQDSLESINSAFFDHSLLGRLYFQDDQKYGIYVPLFVPVGVGLLMSTKNAFRIMFPRESSA